MESMEHNVDPAGTTTPYLAAALPALYAPYVPVNATNLLLEWQSSIDPVGGLLVGRS